jgi:hypothetical protein
LNSWSALTDAERAALGSVVAESANLESSVDFILLHLTNLTHTAYDAMMGGKMLGAKLDVLKAIGLAKLRSKKRKKTFNDLMGKLTSLNGQRTIAVHGIWGPEGHNALRWLVDIAQGKKLPAAAKHKKGILQAAKLETLAKKLSEENSALWSYWRAVWFSPTIARSTRRASKKSDP